MDFIPYIGIIANLYQQFFGDSAPAVSEWAISGGSTVATLAAARAILMLSFWDDVVRRTANTWDDLVLKALRQILAALAVKGKKKA